MDLGAKIVHVYMFMYTLAAATPHSVLSGTASLRFHLQRLSTHVNLKALVHSIHLCF